MKLKGSSGINISEILNGFNAALRAFLLAASRIMLGLHPAPEIKPISCQKCFLSRMNSAICMKEPKD